MPARFPSPGAAIANGWDFVEILSAVATRADYWRSARIGIVAALAKSSRWTAVGRLFQRVMTAAPRHCKTRSSSSIRAAHFSQSGSALPPSFSHLDKARTKELSLDGLLGSLAILRLPRRDPTSVSRQESTSDPQSGASRGSCLLSQALRFLISSIGRGL